MAGGQLPAYDGRNGLLAQLPYRMADGNVMIKQDSGNEKKHDMYSTAPIPSGQAQKYIRDGKGHSTYTQKKNFAEAYHILAAKRSETKINIRTATINRCNIAAECGQGPVPW